MKKYTVGSGISKKVRVRIESFEDMVEYNQQARKNGRDAIEQIEAHARFILENAGFPIDPSAYFEHAAPDMQTPEWYALEVIKKIGWINAEIAKGDPGSVRPAANLGIYVGQLWVEAAMKFRWEPHALRGEEQVSNLAAGRQTVISDDDIANIVADSRYSTRQLQAEKLGLSPRQLLRRLKKMPK